MDPSWHHPHRPPSPLPPSFAPPPQPPPPANGTMCPVCSTFHFPFCPPPFPSTYPPNYYRYQVPPPQPLPPPPPPRPDQFYPRPPQHPPPPIPSPAPYDPFVDPLRGAPQPEAQRPFIDSQRPPWSSNNGFNRDPHGSFYANNEKNYGNVGAKRMRFDDSGFSSSPSGRYANEHSINSSADDERRLKLIRDHGGVKSGEFDRNSGDKRSFDEFRDAGIKPPLNTEFDGRRNFVVQESSAQNIEDGKFVQYGELRGNQFDHRFHQSNVHEHSRNSLNSVGLPMENSEAMRLNQRSVSGYPNDQRSGFGRELHSPGSGLPYQQPPLPLSPPPPLPVESPGHYQSQPVFLSSPTVSSGSLFPVLPNSSAAVASSYPSVPGYDFNKGRILASSGYVTQELRASQEAAGKAYFAGMEVAPSCLSPAKPQNIDASHIIKYPHRASRPDRIVVILRGLPGSGKSHMAKMLRDLEVENGGSVPRIHSIDDYFMTEVEKVQESEAPKTSGTVRGKKAVTKKVMEYCYEPEMEEAYRSSMLKAFKKTLDDGGFNFVIVDDRNLRVADFAQFWATAKRAGYEVYLLEAAYKDPAGCAARNVHGFILDDIRKMADLWEEAPSLYLKLDIKSLLRGDCLEENGIQEVDMDMEDEDHVGGHSSTSESTRKKLGVLQGGLVSDGSLEEDEKFQAEADHPPEEVKELGKSKWSNDLDEEDIHKHELSSKLTPVPGLLLKSCNKEGKSVRWSDEVGNSGFSIAAAKNLHVASLVIGPGAGYNMKSNPLSDKEKKITSSQSSGVSRKQNVFEERLRAERESERESFKAVFDKRRQRISGISGDD
ncbi:OLC1v1012694C2 [Oldenlandia corymbosa var. corymbosa]|uniref:OLC1v1012694C2 n=1 Tax=Oldenlandia corymbosa var. corymbosa TaxID=529605 RepID=A0AAV1E028_OLDCO|nr:OLC1v1012694C2 [Oldenlandia corymbosa var. corymbosa]